MRFDLRQPCFSCPFRKDKSFPLAKERVEQITKAILEQNKTFSCHKTLNSFGETHSHSQHCAGALLFYQNYRTPNRMIRLAEMLEIYDKSKLDNNKVPVYASVQEMIAGCSE